MPDRYGFDHLVWWGQLTVRCIREGCGEGGTPVEWPERRRAQHQLAHQRDDRNLRVRQEQAAIRRARQLKAQAERENRLAYGSER
jgi:hypothetical protein